MTSDSGNLCIEQLFNNSWFRWNEKGNPWLETLFLFMYIPLGLCLFLMRLAVFMQFFLLKIILPESNYKRISQWIMSAALGVSASYEGNPSSTTKVFVSNHVTLLDHFVIHLLTNAKLYVEECKLPKLIQMFLGLTTELNSTDVYVCFPEEDTTNGERGLLSFSDLPKFPNAENEDIVLVQPLGIRVKRIFFNPNSINSGLSTELFITLFLPNSHFTIKFLPVEPWDKTGVQKSIASALCLNSTKFNRSDKAEYIKRINFRPPSFASNVRAVQLELQPIVCSPESIISALQKTGSVENAIVELRKNITQPQFSKNAKDRMISFQERKKLMIQNARIKYAEKHGIDLN